MNRIVRQSLACLLSCLALLPGWVGATSLINPDVIEENRNQAGIFTNYTFDQGTDETTLAQYIGQVLAVFFGLLATIFIVLIVIAGYNWMTAAGEPAKVAKAQSIIKTAIIGLVVLVSAYAITYWIFARLPDNQPRF